MWPLWAASSCFWSPEPSLPVKDTKEFVAFAKANPGKLSYGSAGAGSTPHLAGELFKQQAGFYATHIPYRGAAPALAGPAGQPARLLL
jgi:tripartite-type tricarboxylate transporter receptor subunit TctC